MNQGFKHWIKSFLTLSKFEQRGIVVLVALLAIISGVNFLVPLTFRPRQYSNKKFQAEVARFKAAQKHLEDSLEIVKLQNHKQLTFAQAKARLHPFPFDPNHLTTQQGIKLGLTLKQIQQIQHYVEKGGKFRKKSDFKKMYCISEVEYDILSPYLNIPEIHHKNAGRNSKSSFALRFDVPPASIKINTCDTSQLIKKLHLKPWLALRIIKYRNLLGNFYSIAQLKEVYGLKRTEYLKIKKYFTCDSTQVKKIDLNHASFKQLLHNPYIDYKTTQKIVNTRRNLKGYKHLSELMNRAGIPDSLYGKIRHYLYIKPLKK